MSCEVAKCRKRPEVEVKFREDGRWWAYCPKHASDGGSLRWPSAVSVRSACEDMEPPSWV